MEGQRPREGGTVVSTGAGRHSRHHFFFVCGVEDGGFVMFNEIKGVQWGGGGESEFECMNVAGRGKSTGEGCKTS